MSLPEIQKRPCFVIQDNQLLQSHYSMSLNEKRLILLGISKINPNLNPTQIQPSSFEISAEEWMEVFNMKNKKTVYRDLQDSCRKIMSRHIYMPATKNRPTEKILNWLDSCEYIKNEGKVIVTFGYSISMLLTNFGEFTPCNILEISKLTSFYHIRIYELIYRFIRNTENDKSFCVLNIDELRKMLGLENKFVLYADFKKHVLIPALSEINQHTNINVSLDFEQKKTGKKITSIVIRPTAGKQLNLLEIGVTSENIKTNE